MSEKVVLLSDLEDAINELPADTVLGEEMVYFDDIYYLINGYGNGHGKLDVYEAEIILDEEW